MVKRDILSYNIDKLTEEILQFGVKNYTVKQIYEWLHVKRAASFGMMSNISLSLRTKLDEYFYINSLNIVRKLESSIDNTVKYLYGLSNAHDGGGHDGYIETVLMEYKHGSSLCISTQAGCRMGCSFCASSKAGFSRSLEVSEMLLQIYQTEQESGRNIDSLVLMGIGEPLDNYDNVVEFLRILSHETGKNMSLRHVSLSTCGIVPRIYDLAELRLGLTLSVSLHAYNDEKRSELMPVNKKYPIAELIEACRYYTERTGRRISFEYAVIASENNSKKDAEGLIKLLKGINCHINLIPVNTIEGFDYSATRKDCESFLNMLTGGGLNATIRRTLGADISAACGQLRRGTV